VSNYINTDGEVIFVNEGWPGSASEIYMCETGNEKVLRIRAGLEILAELRSGPYDRHLLEIISGRLPDSVVKYGPPRSQRGKHTRRKKVMIVCSWCNKVELNKNIWVELEVAITACGWLKMKKLPALSHGMCGECYKKVTEQLENPGL
jgi:hypothetical protein